MSAALGMATARDLKGEHHKVIAVVGDGALTCGLSYEGMNNAGHSDRDILLIVNDNGMSISPNVGAISKLLGTIVANPRTDRLRERIKRVTLKLGDVFGDGVVGFARNVEESVKNLFSEGMLFEELGFRYFGPIDGHDLDKLCETLAFVGKMKGPRVLHVLTEKGKGFSFAEANREKWHGLAAYDPKTGEARKKPTGPPTWTQVFGDALTALAADDERVVAITAAMPSGTGTNIFAEQFPERFFDVGIAEGHAVTFAGGLATQGMRPVVAIYSTFLQRAYDNIIHDIAVQRLPVLFCMDRAGLVGEDGQTHMGLYDIAYMLAIPGMTVTAPKDADELVGLLRTALAARRPVLHPVSPRQGAHRSEPDRQCRRSTLWHLGTAQARYRRRHPGRRDHGASRACRRGTIGGRRHQCGRGERPFCQTARRIHADGTAEVLSDRGDRRGRHGRQWIRCDARPAPAGEPSRRTCHRDGCR